MGREREWERGEEGRGKEEEREKGKGERGRTEEGKEGEGNGEEGGKEEKRQNGGKGLDQHIIERYHWLQVEIQNYFHLHNH